MVARATVRKRASNSGPRPAWSSEPLKINAEKPLIHPLAVRSSGLFRKIAVCCMIACAKWRCWKRRRQAVRTAAAAGRGAVRGTRTLPRQCYAWISTIKQLSWIHLPMPQARYKQLVDAYAADIREGRLAPARACPPTDSSPPARGWPGHSLACVRGTGIHGPGQRDRPRYLRARTGMAGLPGHGHADCRRQHGRRASTTRRCRARPEQLRAALRQLAQSGDLDALLRYQPRRPAP